MNWGNAIQRGLDVCDLMILTLSPESMASQNVGNEWHFYFDQHKPIVPILFRPTKLQFQLARLQYVDFGEQEYASALAQLQTELGHVMAPGQVANIQAGPVRKRESDSQLRVSRVPLTILVAGLVVAVAIALGAFVGSTVSQNTFLSGQLTAAASNGTSAAGQQATNSQKTTPLPAGFIPRQIALSVSTFQTKSPPETLTASPNSTFAGLSPIKTTTPVILLPEATGSPPTVAHTPGTPRIIDVAYRSQEDPDARRFSNDNGPACVAIFIEWFSGKTLRIVDLLAETTLVNNYSGLTTTHVVKLANKHGVPLRVVSATLPNVLAEIDAGHPALILINYGAIPERQNQADKFGHYVIVIGYDERGIYFNDPDFWGDNRSLGAKLKVSFAEFITAMPIEPIPNSGAFLTIGKASPTPQ